MNKMRYRENDDDDDDGEEDANSVREKQGIKLHKHKDYKNFSYYI